MNRVNTQSRKPFARRAVLSRIIWRWHFWAGLIAAPVLIVLSVTGALYIFKPDIDPLLAPGLFHHQSDEPVATLQQQVETTLKAAGDGWKVSVIEINERFPQSVGIFMSDGDHHYRRYRVAVQGSRLLGEQKDHPFFEVVLSIHRRLMAGTPGRFLTEITTSWTILLLISGIYLWWPKKISKLGSTLIPRLKAKSRYTVARDAHAVPGAWLFPVAAVIAITGLLYSLIWGSTFLLTGAVSGAFDIEFDPPKSTADPNRTEAILVDRVWDLAQRSGMPLNRVSIEMPHDGSAAFAVKTGSRWGPSVSHVMFVDQYSGDVIAEYQLSQLPIMAQWTQWNYPLHVGSVMGWTSKLIWLVACMILCALPITGIWMWLSRRKKGTSGFPRKYDKAMPKWMLVLIILACIGLPTVGLTLLLVAAVDRIQSRLERRKIHKQSKLASETAI